MSVPKNVVLLGATGSIGENTLAVIGKYPQRFRLAGIAAANNAAALQAIATKFGVPRQCLYSESGIDGLLELATLADAEVVVIATTGTVGLLPALAALEAGKTVALASKEVVVFGGALFMQEVNDAPGQLIPVDSEHNAIFQCLSGRQRADVERILLTASGGPFLHYTTREMHSIQPRDALRHPNWSMGPKITIDSATLANKGLELIEARWLFDVAAENIEVVIHPQSLVHSMVEFKDGSVIAQMGLPSMTLPIQFALDYPEMRSCTGGRLTFDRIRRLDFRPPDYERFPALRMAREALLAGGMAPGVYNCANQVAVAAFLENRIPFLAIPRLIQQCLHAAEFAMPRVLADLVAMEQEIHAFAVEQLHQFRSNSNP